MAKRITNSADGSAKYPDIRRWREHVASALRSSIGSQHQVVASPDHPFLLDGPDVLVATPGTILAIFIPSAIEEGQFRRFEARVKLARAALPSHTVFVGTHNRGESTLLFDMFPELQFYSKGERRPSPPPSKVIDKLVSLSRERRSVKDRDYDVQRAVFERSSKVFKANQLTVGARARSEKEAPPSVEQVRKGLEPSDYRELRVKLKDVAGSEARSIVYSVRKRDWLSVDGDFIEPAENDLGIILTTTVHKTEAGPEKYLRGLAFAGWLAVNDASDLRVARQAEKSLKGAQIGKVSSFET